MHAEVKAHVVDMHSALFGTRPKGLDLAGSWLMGRQRAHPKDGDGQRTWSTKQQIRFQPAADPIS